MTLLQWLTRINQIAPIRRTLLQRLLQHILFPPIQKIPMEARARGIPLTEHKLPSILHDLRHAVQDLEEHMHKLHWMRGRTEAIIYPAHVSDVTIIALIQINAIPARLEMDLRAQAIAASRVRHQWSLFAWIFVKTSETDAVGDRSAIFVGLGGLLVGARGDVSRHHAETGRVGGEVLVVVAAAEVVDYHAAVLDFFEAAVGVLVVEQWGPVGGFIILDFAAGAVCLLKGFEG